MTFNNPFNTDNVESFDPVKGFTGVVPKPKISAGVANIGIQLGAMAGNMAQIGTKQVDNAVKPALQFNNTASFAASGTMLGGPLGTAIGAAAGFGLDMLKYKQGEKEFSGQMYVNGYNAWKMKKKSDVANQDYTGMYKNGGKAVNIKFRPIDFTKYKMNQFVLKKTMFKAASGGKVPVEVEGKEIGILKQSDGSYKEIFKTSSNTRSHEKGGKKVDVPEGTEIFNRELFSEVEKAMSNKNWQLIDKKLIPQRDKILEQAKAQGDPYSTGLTTDEAEMARSGGHMKKPMAFGGSKFRKPSKHASGGVVIPQGLIDAVNNSQSVPSGMPYRFFGGQSFGIGNAMAANPLIEEVAPLPKKDFSIPIFSSKPTIEKLPRQSYGTALKTVAKNVEVPSIKEPSLYDKASIYSLGAAAINAAQPTPDYQRLRRVALNRIKFDSSAIDEAQNENMAASNQILKGFGNSVRGVGNLMGVAANVAKSAMENNSKLSTQKMSAMNQVATQNAQIQNQEDGTNTQIANQESLANEQLRYQHAQAKAQAIKANTDAAFQSQFQEEQLSMQQRAIKAQQDVQKKALSYMVNTDKWFQSLSSPEATTHALSMIEKDDAASKKLLGENVDEFMMLRSDDPNLKSLLDERTKAMKDFEEKGFDETKSFLETNYGKYRSEYDKIAKFERGESDEYNGLKKDADAESRKIHVENARAEVDMSFKNKLKEAGLSDSEIEQLKGTDESGVSSFYQNERVLQALKSRAMKDYVRTNVYEKELSRRMNESRLKMNDYKKLFVKGLGLSEPSPDDLLK